jgi:hypothetical protein
MKLSRPEFSGLNKAVYGPPVKRTFFDWRDNEDMLTNRLGICSKILLLQDILDTLPAFDVERALHSH